MHMNLSMATKKALQAFIFFAFSHFIAVNILLNQAYFKGLLSGQLSSVPLHTFFNLTAIVTSLLGGLALAFVTYRKSYLGTR